MSLNEAFTKWGLTLSVGKTMFMVVGLSVLESDREPIRLPGG